VKLGTRDALKKGLAAAFPKFDEYQLAKYNRGGPIKLRDVLCLCHAKPRDQAQAELWKKLIAGALTTPDTWEVALSSGVDKREAWERLLREQKLGAFALLRNLRNMREAGVDESLVLGALGSILPFRFLAAARYAPQWEETLEQAMLKCGAETEKLPGKTIVLVDVSGSMTSPLSRGSQMQRIDAACGLAVLLREVAENRPPPFVIRSVLSWWCRQAAPRAIPTAPASRSHPKGALRRRPHGKFFSSAITAPSSSIQIRLPVPTRNISAIRDQQQPTQNKPCSTPMRSDCADSFPPCQREVIKDSGERHLSRQAYFNEENW
jgi:hypothetical protein